MENLSKMEDVCLLLLGNSMRRWRGNSLSDHGELKWIGRNEMSDLSAKAKVLGKWPRW